jgi:hypothetical protein
VIRYNNNLIKLGGFPSGTLPSDPPNSINLLNFYSDDLLIAWSAEVYIVSVIVLFVILTLSPNAYAEILWTLRVLFCLRPYPETYESTIYSFKVRSRILIVKLYKPRCPSVDSCLFGWTIDRFRWHLAETGPTFNRRSKDILVSHYLAVISIFKFYKIEDLLG